MKGATIEELRELSRRSRRTQGIGMLALIVAFLLFPAQVFLATWFAAAWLAPLSLAVGGALFVRYAYVAGQERGEFRRVFKRIKETRTLTPEAPAPTVVVER